GSFLENDFAEVPDDLVDVGGERHGNDELEIPEGRSRRVRQRRITGDPLVRLQDRVHEGRVLLTGTDPPADHLAGHGNLLARIPTRYLSPLADSNRGAYPECMGFCSDILRASLSVAAAGALAACGSAQ